MSWDNCEHSYIHHDGLGTWCEWCGHIPHVATTVTTGESSDLELKIADLEAQFAAAQARIAELDPPWVTDRHPKQSGWFQVTYFDNKGVNVAEDHWDGDEWSQFRPRAWRPIPHVTPWKGE